MTRRVMTEEGVRVGDLNERDRIRWDTKYGTSGSERIERLLGYEQTEGGRPSVTFFSERDANGSCAFQRTVALEQITHVNSRRVRLGDSSRQETVRPVASPETDEEIEQLDLYEATIREDLMAKANRPTHMKSRKTLDEMSESQRKHVEFWDPHCAKMKADYVWIAVQRFPERGGEGPYYAAIKRGDKDYAIVDYNTAKLEVKSYKHTVVEDGFETSLAMMEAFKEWRKTAKVERQEAKGKPSAKKRPAAKPKAKKPAAKKPAAKRTAKPKAKPKAPAKKTAAKPKPKVKVKAKK